MKTTAIKVLLAMLCAMVIPGCSDKPGPGQTTGKADTPRQALENMRSTLLAGNSKKAFLGCFDAPGKQEDMLVAFYEFTAVARQFDQAMRKTYGEEAVKEAMGGRNQDAEMKDENWLEDFKIQVDGDTATAFKQGRSQIFRLVKNNGLWKISGKSMLGMDEKESDENIEKTTKTFQLMAEAVTDVSDKIGQTGYTAEKINQELKRAMMMAMMKAADAPALPGQ